MKTEKLQELTQKQKKIIQQTFVQYLGLKLEKDGFSDAGVAKVFPLIIKDSDKLMKEIDKSFIEKITQERINK